MQTRFTPEQLADPVTAEAEGILKQCVHCGICTSTCSSYFIEGDERDSPRGRITLIHQMLEQNAEPGRTVTNHLDKCLSCLSCMTNCPSQINYMHLINLARLHIEKKPARPLKTRLIRKTLASLLPNPGRFRMGLYLGLLAKPLKNIFPRIGLPELGVMMELLPQRLPRRGKYGASGTIRADKRALNERKRVMLLQGCNQQVLRPSIHDATVEVLKRSGIDIFIPARADCCGAVEYQLGKNKHSIHSAKRIVDAMTKAESHNSVDAVIITASGCGTHLKDYAHILRNEKGYAKRAKLLAEKTRDISEYLVDHVDMRSPVLWTSINVAYHAACSLQHGQQINTQPRELLKNSGFTIVEIPEDHLCCGSAGVYNILQPQIASKLMRKKVDNIHALKPDVIATGNLGCLKQISRGTEIPVVHIMELIAWAQTGVCPEELRHLEHKVNMVDKFIIEQEPKKESSV